MASPVRMRDCREMARKTVKNFARYQRLAKRFLKAGRLPALLFSVARKREKLGERYSDLATQLKLLQTLCLSVWLGGVGNTEPLIPRRYWR